MKTSNRVLSTLAVIIGLLLVVPCANAQTSNKGSKAPQLVVKGTLKRPDRSPATGVKVYIFPSHDSKLSHWLAKVGEKWDLGNPSATTDAKGQFAIRFTEAEIIQRRGRCVLGCKTLGSPRKSDRVIPCLVKPAWTSPAPRTT
jgi:hypothetical protein